MSLRSLFVVFVILIPGIIKALGSRFKALVLYLWYAFFRPQDWIYWDITSLRLSLVIGLILLVPCLLTGVYPNLSHPLSLGALAFFVTMLIAQINAVNQAVGWQWIDFFGRLLVVCLLAVTLIRTPRDFMRVLAVVACSLGFYGAKAGFMSLTSGGVQYSTGLAGAFVDSDGYALAIVMTMPLLVAVAQNAQLTFANLIPAWSIRWVRLGLYVAVPFCGFTVISTFSRGGLLGMVAAVFTFLLLHPRRVRLILAFTVLAVVAVETIPLPEGYAQRVQSIGMAPSDDPNADPGEGRLHFWQVAMKMAADHPFGVGIRNFESNYDAYDTLAGAYGTRRASHSSHFQVLAELGYDGLVIWLGMFIYAFTLAFRIRRRARTPGLTPQMVRLLETVPTALIVSMVGFLVAGAFIALALNDLTWVTFSLVAALDRVSMHVCAGVSTPAAGRL